ncbi:hypothetical protein CsSME_00008099 [Camellia sinensis var. sinensis]
MAIHNNILVKFNVGGKIFETTTSTLANAGHNSFVGKMFDKNWNLQTYNSADGDGNYFIDWNPDCFAVLLDLLRTGELYIPSNIPEKILHREALFYGLLDNVRSAKWGQFDGNRLPFSHSVTDQAPGDGTAIRGSPDGGCCVVHDSMVHVYDWMLEEHPPINLDYQRVYDVGWVDLEDIVVSAGGGGMGLFSVASGELRHMFQVTNEDHQVKSYTAGALSFNSRLQVFF